MCVVLVPNIGVSTSVSNTTQIRPQHFRNFMCVHWECAWSQCQIFILAPAFPALHKYAHSTSEPSCVSTRNVRGGQCQGQGQGQGYTKITICKIMVFTPTCLKLHRYARNFLETSCEGMRMVLLQNIGIRTSISNITQIRPQQLKNFICVHWECAWCSCQILVLAPAYPTQHKDTHSSLQTSCVSTGNVRGASAYIGFSTSISNTTQIRPQHFRNFMCVHWECAWCQCIYWYQHQHIQHNTKTPTAVYKLHVCPLGMCGVLVPNIGISTSISNTTQIRPQHFRIFMCIHWECAQRLGLGFFNVTICQIFLLTLAHFKVHKYACTTS